MRRRAALVLPVLVVVLALVATGCGGGGEPSTEATPAAEWADGLCSAITTWTDELQAIRDRFSDPSSVSQDAVEGAASDARDATQTFLDDVQALGRPDTESGQQAADELDALSTELESSLDRVESEVEGASGITGAIGASAIVVGEFAKMGAALTDTFRALEGIDASGELQAAFEQAGSCDELTGSSEP
jgi:hypothetical protein